MINKLTCKLSERMKEKGITEEELDSFLSEYVKTNLYDIFNQLFNQMLFNGETFISIDKDCNVKVITDINEIENIKENYK